MNLFEKGKINSMIFIHDNKVLDGGCHTIIISLINDCFNTLNSNTHISNNIEFSQLFALDLPIEIKQNCVKCEIVLKCSIQIFSPMSIFASDKKNWDNLLDNKTPSNTNPKPTISKYYFGKKSDKSNKQDIKMKGGSHSHRMLIELFVRKTSKKLDVSCSRIDIIFCDNSNDFSFPFFYIDIEEYFSSRMNNDIKLCRSLSDILNSNSNAGNLSLINSENVKASMSIIDDVLQESYSSLKNLQSNESVIKNILKKIPTGSQINHTGIINKSINIIMESNHIQCDKKIFPVLIPNSREVIIETLHNSLIIIPSLTIILCDDIESFKHKLPRMSKITSIDHNFYILTDKTSENINLEDNITNTVSDKVNCKNNDALQNIIINTSKKKN